jgi:type VI protein secretion system component VasK
MPRHRRPAWGLLYALVPLLAGLFMVEHRAPLSPGGHTAVQVGIALFIYGLVWLWLQANALRLMWRDQLTADGQRAMETDGAAIGSPRARFTPSQAYIRNIRARHRHRRVHPQGKGRGIRKCSLNFDRRSS